MDGDPARGRPEILIVDDEPLQRETIRLCIDEEYGVREDVLDVALLHLPEADESPTSSIEEAAETLGVAPSTLWRKRRKYDL